MQTLGREKNRLTPLWVEDLGLGCAWLTEAGRLLKPTEVQREAELEAELEAEAEAAKAAEASARRSKVAVAARAVVAARKRKAMAAAAAAADYAAAVVCNRKRRPLGLVLAQLPPRPDPFATVLLDGKPFVLLPDEDLMPQQPPPPPPPPPAAAPVPQAAARPEAKAGAKAPPAPPCTVVNEEEGWLDSGHEWIGASVRRFFAGGVVSDGEVVRWLPAEGDDAALWHMVHEDGDEEDLEEDEVRALPSPSRLRPSPLRLLHFSLH